MADVLFTNVRIFDGGGEAPFTGDVLVQGNRIARVVKTGYGARPAPVSGAQVIDGAGAFLMPGMVEAHTHFSWNDQPSLDAIQRMPPEEHILWCAEVAKRYLDMGWTSCVGAAAAKPRLDVVIRNAINDGTIIGPRYLAASQEITVPGGLGDTTQPHLPQPEFAFGAVVSGAEEMRRCVRMFAKYGVDSLKINLSGESITGMPSEMSQFTEEEITVCVQEAKAWGKRVAAHARSTWSIKQCVKQGIEVIYHASFTDERGARHARGAQDRALHRARPGLAHQHLPSRERVGPDARGDDARWATTASSKPRSRACARCASAASASCPAATTASPGRRTAPTRRTWSTSSSTSA